MIKLTIHTSTYNRAYILPKAYESLKKQTCKDFEWIITDDGSTDETEKLVNGWLKEENGFELVYNKLNHVGLPRANNSGINKARSDWFLILDSDDYLLPETVEKVLIWLEEIMYDKSYAGIGFARSYPDGRYMKDQVPLIDEKLGYIDATHLERKNYHIDMDMCEVQRTEVLKKYPFQCWESEIYAPPGLNHFEMALDGLKLRWRAEKLYICEYLPDGITKSDKKVKENPMGYAMMFNQNLIFTKSLKRNIFNAIQMIALSLYAGHPEYLKQSNKKWLTTICLPFGWIWSIRRKRQFSRIK